MTSLDVRFMCRALALAARGFTHPNPMVGCVLVRDGRVVGEGWHRMAGLPHAEAEALAAAGDTARGSTAYVSLEPCAHHGRTPPCADALVRAGVARVVCAMEDPFPQVAGRGFSALRAAGIEVDVGLLHAEALSLNAAFVRYHTTGLPLVTLKAAVTLDGRIATRTGDSRWVTGERARAFAHRERARAFAHRERARAFAHRERARSGAILCGIGTVLADDPMLTARFRGVPRQPLRVMLDSALRMPLGSRLVQSAGEYPTVVVGCEGAPRNAAEGLRGAGAEVALLPSGPDGRPGVGEVLRLLAERGITSVLVEGGAAVHAAFLKAGAVDRLLWFVAPKIIGADGHPAVGDLGVDVMAEAHGFTRKRLRVLGEDVLMELVRPGG